jgi:hypothetical protein
VRAIFQAAMGELYRLQSRARAVAAANRLPEAQRATLLGPPHAALLDALQGTPPLLDGVRLHSAFAHAPESRAEVARADLLLDEAAAQVKLLVALGLSPETLGAAAASAGIAPSALRASDAVRAMVASDLRGGGFSLAGAPEAGSALPAEFAQRLDARLADAVASLPDGPERLAARRMAERLRALVLA